MKSRFIVVSAALFLLFSVIFLVGCDCGCDDDDDSDRMPMDDDTSDDDTFSPIDDDTVTDDDVVDDDTVDDDTVDDDTVDDDSTDDDTVLPPEVTISPGDGEQDVSLNTAVIISAEIPLDPETLDFHLSTGLTEIEGQEQFSHDGLQYYFYPSALLDENTEYTVNFEFEGDLFATNFDTIESVGEIPIAGNAGAAPGEFFGFTIEPVDILQPAGLSELILYALDSFEFIIAPVFLEVSGKESGLISFAGGEAKDFDGDGNLEQNYSSAGLQYGGWISGSYLSMSGSFTVEIREALITANLAFFSATIEDDGLGNPSIPEGKVAVTTYDCEGLKQAFPYFEMLIDFICDPEQGLFGFASFQGNYNPIADLAFDPPVITEDDIEVTFDPPLYADHPAINPLNANFEIYQDSELVLSSMDYLDNVDFVDCCTEIGPEWFSFSDVVFHLPEEIPLTPGDYTLRFFIGVYGMQTDFTVGADDDTTDDDVIDDDTADDDVVDDDTTEK